MDNVSVAWHQAKKHSLRPQGHPLKQGLPLAAPSSSSTQLCIAPLHPHVPCAPSSGHCWGARCRGEGTYVTGRQPLRPQKLKCDHAGKLRVDKVPDVWPQHSKNIVS